MKSIWCLFGCQWECQPKHTYLGSKEIYTWKCSRCGKRCLSKSSTDPTVDLGLTSIRRVI